MASIADNVLTAGEPTVASAHLTKLQQVRFPIALLLPGPVIPTPPPLSAAVISGTYNTACIWQNAHSSALYCTILQVPNEMILLGEMLN